ncbi:MAG: NADH:ubiquinone oxidoreductase [Oligoflexia bacterium]|nr:NADH:ubiquinone oxidoreductase [Oligoflexia bacterium]MBF0366218.1 NADH:ubiquinone oxidoreductase [Oligoflexia bacterium]
MSKPKVGFFDFSSCEGCQIELTNYGDTAFLELLNHIDIVEFREAMTETAGDLDIACVEGSFTREADRARLESIRKRSKIVIAYGACAATAGVNALKNHQADYKENVYGKDAHMPHLDSSKALPISAAIKVDYSVYGCPMDKYEFLRIVTHLLHGKEPVIPNYPVCMECKRRETVCRYEDGDHCMGQVARAGCNAPCPADGIPCEACRGFVDQPNEVALVKVLKERAGFSEKRAQEKSRIFTAALRSDSK